MNTVDDHGTVGTLPDPDRSPDSDRVSVDALAAALPGSGRAESVGLLAELAAARAAGRPVPAAGMVDAVLAAGRLAAWAQAQQLRWLAAFARPGIAVPIGSVLTALCNGGNTLLTTGQVQPAFEDFEAGVRWEDTTVHGDPNWDLAVQTCAVKFAAAEISAAMRVAPVTAAHKLATAVTLHDRLPATLAMLETGLIDYGHVAALLDATTDTDPDVCAAVEDRFLTPKPEPTNDVGADTTDDDDGAQPSLDFTDHPDDETGETGCEAGDPDPTDEPAWRPAAAASMTPGQLGRAAAAAIVAADPDAAARRAEAARARRGTGVRGLGDDMSRFYADLLAPDAATTQAFLDHLAAGLPRSSRDGRGVGQIRADIFADLMTHLATHGHIDLRTSPSAAPTAADGVDRADVADCADAANAATPRFPDAGPCREGCCDGYNSHPAPPADSDTCLSSNDPSGPEPATDDTCAHHGDVTDERSDGGDSCRHDNVDGGGTCSHGDGSEFDYDDWWTERSGPITLRPGFATRLDVTVALSTLAGFDDHAAQLTGHGAITADLARALAAAATTITLTPVTDPPARRCEHPGCHDTPDCGTGLDRGHSIYQPPDKVADHVRHRDRICRFVGCQQPADRCDLDHRITFDDGGSTCPCDLDSLCRAHHRLKTFSGWHAVRTDNSLTWTSPLGRTYTEPSPPVPVGTQIPDSATDPAPF